MSLLIGVLFSTVGCGGNVGYFGQAAAPSSKPSKPIPSGLTITPSLASITSSSPQNFQAVMKYSDGSTQDLTATAIWSSDDPSVLRLTANGVVACLGSGKTTFTATVDGVTSSSSVSCILPSIIGLSFLDTPEVIRSNNAYQYHVTAKYADGSTEDVTASAIWNTDPTIVGLLDKGQVSCNNAGTTKISASLSGLSVTASVTCVLSPITRKPGFLEHASTFAGPFASWINVKTAFGAMGDGVTNDTDALQAALNYVQRSPAVLWVPKGTYLITRPLTISGVADFTVLGEDPLNTTIVWAGPPGGTMLTLSGCMGFDLGRLTWDGHNQANVALEVTWDDHSNYYPTRNLIHDSRINNVMTGIHTGWAGETTVDRVHFDHNTQAGVSLGDWNALNFNVVDSLFTDDAIGVTNIYGAGAFNVSNSVFVGSSTSDIAIGNTGPFSIRNNLSVKSQMFLQTGMTGAPANIVVENNTIYQPAADPIGTGTPGSLMIVDNAFLGLSPDMHLLDAYCAQPLTFLSIGNSYSTTQPFAGYLGDYVSIDEASDAALADAGLPWPVPAEIYIPPVKTGAVFDLASGSTGDQIQAAIMKAASVNGTVHLSKGDYSIGTTLKIPAQGNVKIVGDGALSTLLPAESLTGPVLESQGTNVEIENLQFAGSNSGSSALHLLIPDTPASEVLCDECALAGGRGGAGIQVDGLDDALVQVKVGELNTDGDPNSFATNVHGGVGRQAAAFSLGSVDEYMVSSSAYAVDSGGHLLVEDGWHDGGQGANQGVLSNNGSVTQQGGAIYSSDSSEPSVALNNFNGSFSLLGVVTNSFVGVSNSAGSSVLAAAVLQTTGERPVQAASGAKVVEVLNSSTTNNSMPSLLPGVGTAPSLLEHLASTARTELLTPRLSRIASSNLVRLSHVVGRGNVVSVDPINAPQVDGTYSIAPALSGLTPESACPNHEVAITGRWTLLDGGDGYWGLAQGGQILSEDLVAHAQGNGMVWRQSMVSARDRWAVQAVGDGSVTIVNRATGHLLTASSTGCAYVVATSEMMGQRWLITGQH